MAVFISGDTHGGKDGAKIFPPADELVDIADHHMFDDGPDQSNAYKPLALAVGEVSGGVWLVGVSGASDV